MQKRSSVWRGPSKKKTFDLVSDDSDGEMEFKDDEDEDETQTDNQEINIEKVEKLDQ